MKKVILLLVSFLIGFSISNAQIIVQKKELPAQTGNAGKVLGTNGTNPSWIAIPTGTAAITPTLNAGQNVDINQLGFSYTISSTTPTLTVSGGTLSGVYPTQTITIPTSSTTILTGTNNASVTGTAPNYTINVPSPTLTVNGATLTGAYPTQTLTIPAAGDVTTTATQTLTNKTYSAAVLTGTATAQTLSITGTAYTPTIAANDNSTKVANTAYIDNAIATKASTIITLPSDAVTTATTGTTVYTVSVDANSTYIMRGYLSVGCSNTGGVKFATSFPSGATTRGNILGRSSNATSFVQISFNVSGTFSGSLNTVNSTGGFGFYQQVLTTGVTAGTFTMQMASTTNGETSSVYSSGTYFEVIKL